MKFCANCDNMYYISVGEKDANQLTYYCRNCGHKDDTLTTDGVCVMKSHLKKGEQKFNHIINRYTKMDPSLPRVRNMVCPTATCATNTDKEHNPSEVIYMRYDDDNLKYLYICVTCDTVWKTDAIHP